MEILVEDMDFSNLDSRVEHLKKEQIVDLMKEYYAGEKVAKILGEYQIKISASQLYTLFPPVITDEVCMYCESNLVKPWESKSMPSFINENKNYCSSCGHKNSRYCTCSYCEEAKLRIMLEEQEKQREIIEQKRSTLASFYDESNWVLKYESDLTLEDRLYLAVILRSSLSENTMYIETLKVNKNLLAPTEAFEIELIKTLTGRKIIVPHVLSDINAFEIEYKDDGDFQITYGIYNVRYRVNVEPFDSDYNAMIKRLLYPDFSSEEMFKEFCYEMWKTISLNECLEYLLYQMNKVGYAFNPGDKTVRVFEYLLEHFSVAQIYGIIYRSVANSTQRYQAGDITFKHAQNSVITSCESHGQRALAQGWRLSNYSRIRDLPETYISSVLFTTIMQIAELGFSEKPTPNF